MSVQAEVARDLQTRWSPEMQVLIACARDVDGTREFNLPSGVDWQKLLRLAETHGLNVLLHRRMQSQQESEIPASFLRALDESQRISVQTGLRHTAILAEIFRNFHAAGVQALAYKGPALSVMLYGNPAVRPAADLDILIRPETFSAARNVLASLGFQPGRVYPPGTEGQLCAYRAEFAMVRAGVLAELQWRLAPHYFSVELDIAELEGRAKRIEVGGVELPVMAAEDTLLTLCIHGAKHHWQSLKWILDIDRLIRTQPALAWEVVERRAADLGTLRLLRLGLKMSQHVLHTPLPAAVTAGMEGDAALHAISGPLVSALETPEEPHEAAHHKLMLALRERRSDRIRYLFRLAHEPTESEWESAKFSAPWRFLYHGVRAWRVAAKSLRTLFS